MEIIYLSIKFIILGKVAANRRIRKITEEGRRRRVWERGRGGKKDGRKEV